MQQSAELCTFVYGGAWADRSGIAQNLKMSVFRSTVVARI